MYKNYLKQLFKYSTAFTSIMILIVSVAFALVNHIANSVELGIVEGYLTFVVACWIITTMLLAWVSEVNIDD